METTTNYSDTKYPIGIQSFERIINGGYAYVDKTAFVYRLVSEGDYYFLSRPRRFGKSLLLSTIEAYFQGRKDLFKGLDIERLHKGDWPKDVAIFRMDLSPRDYSDYDKVEEILNSYLDKWEALYGKRAAEVSYESRFGGVIERAHLLTGQRVVILVDEYDSPILANLHDPELSERMRNLIKGFYTNVKAQGDHIQFAFFTGVSRFSRLTIFSGINNLKDITMRNDFATICGMTEEELTANFEPGIRKLACVQGAPYEQTLEKLRLEYDGYRFSAKSPGIYNPFSLLNCLDSSEYGNYWYASGTPSFLIKIIERGDWDLYSLVNNPVESDTLTDVESYMTHPEAILFQTGYLTIKSYDSEDELYQLAFPNREVRDSLIKIARSHSSHG